MFEVAVLIEARAGRREKAGIARLGMFGRPLHRVMHVAGRYDHSAPLQRGSDPVGRRSDRDDVTGLLTDEIAHALELAGFVLPAEDQEDAGGGEAFQRAERGIDVRSLRVVDPANAAAVADEHHPMWEPR